MRKNIHPDNYRLVAFKDMSNDDLFITKSTVNSKETIEVKGVEYPLVKLEISRTSHPFFLAISNASPPQPHPTSKTLIPGLISNFLIQSKIYSQNYMFKKILTQKLFKSFAKIK